MNKTIVNKGDHLVCGKERYVALKDFEIDYDDANISEEIHRGNITITITEPDIPRTPDRIPDQPPGRSRPSQR